MTHNQYTATACNGNQRTAAYRLLQIGVKYDGVATLTDAQLAQLSERFSRKEKAQDMPKPATQPATQTAAQKPPQKTAQLAAQTPAIITATTIAEAPAKKASTEQLIMFYFPFAVTLTSIALTIGGLTMFAGAFGMGLGIMFACFLFGAAFVARNKQKGDTSAAALNTVLYLELGACVLHLFTFRYAMQIAGPDWLLWCASGLMAAFVAVISYNSVQLIRNYNAE